MKRRGFLQLLGLGTVVASCGPCQSLVEARPEPSAPPVQLEPVSFRGVEFLIERDLTEAFAQAEDLFFLRGDKCHCGGNLFTDGECERWPDCQQNREKA